MTSIKDVARESGVSTATVSRIINNQPKAATDKTRQNVLDTMRRLNYRPSAVARGLSCRRMNTLGVVFVSTLRSVLAADSYYARILDGVLVASKQAHQKTLLYFEDTWAEAHRNLSSYSDRQCDGLILLGPVVSPAFFETLQNHRVPFVVTGGSPVAPDVSMVAMDDPNAGYQSTAYLLEQGHRRIAYLPGDDAMLSSSRRLQGYRQALEAWHVPFDDQLTPAGTYGPESGFTRAQALWRRPPASRPTALFCGDDWIALGALNGLRELGVRVPEDVSLVGVNDSFEAERVHPLLTSVRQPSQQIGQRLVELLLAQMADRTQPALHQLYPGELIVRDSVAPPPIVSESTV